MTRLPDGARTSTFTGGQLGFTAAVTSQGATAEEDVD
jgi:hypothetical protein